MTLRVIARSFAPLARPFGLGEDERMRGRALAAIGFVACAACGESRPPAGGDPVPVAPAGTDGGFAVDAGVTPAPECSEPTTFVYVVSQDGRLYRFEPDKLKFTLIGSVPCLGKDVFSMAVDRRGLAWVNTGDASLYVVSTIDASCQATTFQRGQHGFNNFGMGFATNGPSSTAETLYVVGSNRQQLMGLGLARIDDALVLTPIGDFSGMLQGQEAELTGTGDGRLYGFFVLPSGAALARIDPATGATDTPKDLPGVATATSAWAFSFWGGDFWFYSADDITTGSRVTQLKTSGDGSLSVVVPDVGFIIVGAGVSTCAPTTPPM